MRLCALLLAAAAAVLCAEARELTPLELLRGSPALPLGLFKDHVAVHEASRRARVLAPSPATHEGQQHVFDAPAASATYKTRYFDQRVTHNTSSEAYGRTFKQRYWLDDSFYRPGGPIFFLDGGETSGADRIPFLESGILRILSEATHGVGIVFEHRYYGTSFPVNDLSLESLQYLTTNESLEDSAYFARTFQAEFLEGKEHPWIYYGGSYAGAKAAFARAGWPDVWWGAIASSGVTLAVEDYWEYFEPIRLHAPKACMSLLASHTELIDSLLGLKSPLLTRAVKGFFGLANVTSDADFVNALTVPLGYWQAKNWDHNVGSDKFDDFCDTLTGGNATSLSASPHSARLAAEALLAAQRDGGAQGTGDAFQSLRKYADWIKTNVVARCPTADQDECFGTTGPEFRDESLATWPWRSWTYQVCTEWGYFQGAAPENATTIVSRLLTTNYTSQICREAFPPTDGYSVPLHPNVDAVNSFGALNLTMPRLAFVDGSYDPWIYATPHSPHAPERNDTLSEPFKLIKGGVHHWDENGLLDTTAEPRRIRHIHKDEVHFVKAWLKEWRKSEKGQVFTANIFE